MADLRLFLDEVYVDCADDEVILVKKIDALLQGIKRNRERLVVIIVDEERAILKIRRNPNVP